MNTELGAHPAVTPPDHYTVDVHSTGDVHDAVVRTTGGEHAAKGGPRCAGVPPSSTWWSPTPHTAGAVRAVLVATEAGRALYEKLGWTVESPITAAHLPAQ